MTNVNGRGEGMEVPVGLDRPEARVAIDAARRAGDAALRFYGSAIATMKPGNSPVTEADHAANDVILSSLRAAFPGDAMLSEESVDSPDRRGADRLWIVDPLDGTKEFLAQNGDFAVMIGFVERGRPVVGVIHLPVTGAVFAAADGGGSWVLRGEEWARVNCARVDPADIRLVGSRSHPEPLVTRVAEDLGITDVMPSGSVGVKCSYIAEGFRDLYLHPVGYLGEWDTCAPEVLVREAGGHVSDCRGEPLRYDKAVPTQPHGILVTGRLPDSAVVDRIAEMYREGRSAE